MRHQLLKLWPWVVIGIALVFSMPFLVVRSEAENTPAQVELIMDYVEVEMLARWWGGTPESVLTEMSKRGLTSVSVPEMTLGRLRDAGRITMVTGADVLSRARLLPGDSVAVTLAPYVISPGYTYVLTDNKELAEDIVQRAARRPTAELRRLTGEFSGYWVVEFGGSHELLANVGLGFDEDDVERIVSTGLLAVPRPRNVPDLSREEIRDMIAGWSGSNLVIAHGQEITGFPFSINIFAEQVKRAGLVPGLVESPNQLGFIWQRGWRDLVEASDYEFVRVFTISQQELEQMSVANAAEMYVRAARERNIRALYVRPVTAREYQGRELEMTMELIERISSGLGAAGFASGPARPFPKVTMNTTSLLAAVAGVLAAGILLLRMVLPLTVNLQLKLWLGMFLVWVLLSSQAPDLARLAAAFGAAVVFPVVAVFGVGAGVQGSSSVGTLVRVLSKVILIVVCSVVGGLLITVILGDSRFLLEVDYFQGVKLSYVLPLVLGVLVWAGNRQMNISVADLKRRVSSLLSRPVTIADVGIVLIIGIIAYVYLGRSGHDAGLAATNLEMIMRDGLERFLGVRPRFKEYLIGTPALVVGLMLYARGLISTPLAWQIVGITGQVSIVNSFVHLRTPLVLTLLRTVHGLWLGLVIGAGVGVVCWLWLRSSDVGCGGRQRCPE